MAVLIVCTEIPNSSFNNRMRISGGMSISILVRDCPPLYVSYSSSDMEGC